MTFNSLRKMACNQFLINVLISRPSFAKWLFLKLKSHGEIKFQLHFSFNFNGDSFPLLVFSFYLIISFYLENVWNSRFVSETDLMFTTIAQYVRLISRFLWASITFFNLNVCVCILSFSIVFPFSLSRTSFITVLILMKSIKFFN